MAESSKRRKLSLKRKPNTDAGKPNDTSSMNPSISNVTADHAELRKKVIEWQWSQRPRDCDWSSLPDLPDDVPVISTEEQKPKIDAPKLDESSPAADKMRSVKPITPSKIGIPIKTEPTLPQSNAFDDAVASTSTVIQSTMPAISSCPICQLEFPIGQMQIDMDAHIALCLSCTDDW